MGQGGGSILGGCAAGTGEGDGEGLGVLSSVASIGVLVSGKREHCRRHGRVWHGIFATGYPRYGGRSTLPQVVANKHTH